MTTFAFEPRSTDFSMVNSLACAQASRLAYRDVAEVKATASEWGFAGAEHFKKTTHDAIVLSNRNAILVAFRGTDEGKDFRTNVDVRRGPSSLGEVHRGFMEAAASFWPDLHQHVLTTRNNDQALWFTGHSLGGALALLASVKAHFEDGLPVSCVYTFGQPQLASLEFRREFEERRPYPYYRFVNHTDVVVDVPMLAMLTHFGEVRYFDTKKKLWEGKVPWWVKLVDKVRAPHLHGGLADFAAHAIDGYVELIAARVAE